MKKLNVTVQCMAVYNSSIDVPDEMTLEEAIEYAKQHIDEIPVGELEWISDSDVVDEENSCFDYDGMKILCPDCGEEITIEFGMAKCEECGWMCADSELDDIMEA